jgi:hypothetical protein
LEACFSGVNPSHLDKLTWVRAIWFPGSIWQWAQEFMRTLETSAGSDVGGTFACSCVVCAKTGFATSATNKMAQAIAAVNLIKFFIVGDLKDWKIMMIKVQQKNLNFSPIVAVKLFCF